MTDISKLEPKFLKIANSKEAYPVNFDDAWKWIGYSTKRHAKESLEKNFSQNYDYLIFTPQGEKSKRGRPSENITLTKECFKQFCMLAQTPKGKEVRDYYLKCESKLLEIANDTDRQKIRDKSKQIRNEFTDTLKSHGVDKPHHYITITNDMKKSLSIDRTTKKDNMSSRELKKVLLSETLASIRMEDNNVVGFYEARPVCIESSNEIQSLVENKAIENKTNLFGVMDI